MREKLQTLPLSELKEMAKGRGIKGINSLKKTETIDLPCDETEKNPDIEPAEIKREVKTETSRSQETPRSQKISRNQETPRSREVSRSQETPRSRDQPHAFERNQSRSQDYRENRNDNRGTDNHRPVSKGYDGKYT